MTLPTYTPYDGSSQPFTIGLLPLDVGRWIEPDGDLPRRVSAKSSSRLKHAGMRFSSLKKAPTPLSRNVSTCWSYLCEAHPDLYERNGSLIEVVGKAVDLSDQSCPRFEGNLACSSPTISSSCAARTTAGISSPPMSPLPSSWSLHEKVRKADAGDPCGRAGLR